MSRTTALLALLLTSTLGCSLRDRQPVAVEDGAPARTPDARTKLAPDRDARPDPRPDLLPPSPDVGVDTTTPALPVCPAPCAPQEDCVSIYPNTTKGICLRRCSSGCGPCGMGCNQCLVEIAGTKYCMDMCWWKGSAPSCPDPNAQGCVDAYGIPGALIWPGYPGSKVCVP